jgi:nucleoside-diphosphate-sugar epimerase
MHLQTAFVTALLASVVCLGRSTDTSDAPTSVLVTGAAGFIGSHVVIGLAQHGFGNIAGVDNFNADYSVALKRDRAALVLNATAVKIQDYDICSTDVMLELFSNNSFTHIVNLVPPAAIEESDCFGSLLRGLIPLKRGDHTKLPIVLFVQPADAIPTENALHKRFHRIPFVMFALPPVYGPGDRPDRPVTALVRDIITGGDTSTLANVAADGLLTNHIYIDDVVSEIVAAAAMSRKEMQHACVVYRLTGSLTRADGAQRMASSAVVARKGSSVFPKCAHLTLNATTTIEQGLAQFSDWYRTREARLTPCQSECSHKNMCFVDGWEAPAEMSRKLTQNCKVVFYTVGTQQRTDELHPSPQENIGCNIAFLNSTSVLYQRVLAASGGQGPLTYQNWIFVPLVEFSKHYSDTRKPTRVPKLNPGMFFSPKVEIAIYGDTTIHIYNIAEVIKKMAVGPRGEAVAFAAVQHPVHPSVYSQIEGIVRGVSHRLITYYPVKIVEQRDSYKSLQHRYDGLNFDNCFDGGMLYHDMKSPIAKQFRCRWMREYMEWCDRDEISGSFLLAMMNYEYGKSPAMQGAEWISIGEFENTSSYIHILSKKERKKDSAHRFYEKTAWHYNP